VPIPEYVVHLRAHVGTDLLWLSGVSAVVLDDDRRVLLVRRADTGRWALVSGILEPGEEPARALVREVAEETRVAAEVVALTYVSVTTPVTYPNGDRAQYLDLTFLCRYLGGTAAVGDEESTDVRWFALDTLPADLTPTSQDRLAHTLEYLEEPARGARFRR
jgi:ADP-ribose pyrophosphatase YjhB (NUDIX family)